MKNLVKFLLSLAIVVSANFASAAPFTFKNAGYINGDWTYGCVAFESSNFTNGAGVKYKRNRCFVYAPANPGNVTSYGFQHTSDGWSNWPNQSSFYDSQDVSNSWVYAGQMYNSTDSTPIVEHPTYGILYWTSICQYHYFYYSTASAGYGLESDSLCNYGVSI